jgi:hypothetical protein
MMQKLEAIIGRTVTTQRPPPFRCNEKLKGRLRGGRFMLPGIWPPDVPSSARYRNYAYVFTARHIAQGGRRRRTPS